MGGSELNASPILATDRWIIDFENRTLEEARTYPELLSIVEEGVKPYVRRPNWWQFEHRAVGIQSEIRRHGLKQVLIVAETSDTFAFAFGDTRDCYSNKIVIFSADMQSLFLLLQSRAHETWVRTVSSTLKDDLSYVPGDSFDTFPLPDDWQERTELEDAGTAYYAYRVALMVQEQEGFTDIYNRFHNPDERSAHILRLREVHDGMDRAALDAYGWTDIRPTCEFLLDYEEEEGEDENGGRASRRRKPWRYRWPDEIRDEVLARLLDLNQKRAEEERLAGVTADAAEKKKAKGKGRGRKKKSDPNQQKMFGEAEP